MRPTVAPPERDSDADDHNADRSHKRGNDRPTIRNQSDRRRSSGDHEHGDACN
jgi:hypothetical protein